MTALGWRRWPWARLFVLGLLTAAGVGLALRTNAPVAREVSDGPTPGAATEAPPPLASRPAHPTHRPGVGDGGADVAGQRVAVSGRIVDDRTSGPVVGARVLTAADSRRTTVERAVGDRVRAEPDGTFRVTGPLGEHGTVELLVAAEGYVPRYAVVSPGGVAEIRLERGNTIEGSVVDLDGQPIPDVEVLALSDQTVLDVARGVRFPADAATADFAVGRTDATGIYRVRGVTDGVRYRVTPRRRGWGPTPRELQLGLPVVAPAADLVLKMEPAFETEVFVRDAVTLEPIPEPTFRYSSPRFMLPPHLSEAQADPGGDRVPTDPSAPLRWVWSGSMAVGSPSSPGHVDVVVSALGYRDGVARLPLRRAGDDGAPVNVDLEPKTGISSFGTLRLRFTDVDGRDLHGRAYFALQIGAERMEFAGRELEDGLVTLRRLPAGIVRIEAVLDGQADGTFDPITVQVPEGEVQDVGVRMRRMEAYGRLVVEPTDEALGPLAACDLVVATPRATLYRHGEDAVDRPRTRHVFTLPPGRARVEIRRFGYEAATRSVDVEAGADTSLVVRLQPRR